MSHECELCGDWCYCDGDDVPTPQEDSCSHVCEPEWDDEAEWGGEDDERDCLDCGTCEDCVRRSMEYDEATYRDDRTLSDVNAEDEADRERYEIEKGIASRDGDGNYRNER